VLLSGEEALGTLLALAVAERLGFPLLGAELGRARRKIIDAFPAAERKRIAPLRERVFVGPPASAPVRASYRHPMGVAIQRLQAAFVAERVIEAEYAKESGSVDRRRLEPHAIVVNWPAWYLIAFDTGKSAARTFRLDRFRGVTVLGESFRARPREVAAELLDDPRISISAL